MRQAHADVLADYRAESMDVPENVSLSINYRGSRMDCSVQFQEQLTPEMLRALTMGVAAAPPQQGDQSASEDDN